jgi:ferrous iron transport protein A
MTLKNAVEGKEYIISDINTGDKELELFLFSLGCYAGQPITVISHLKGSSIISLKNARYNIDSRLADSIFI